MLNVKFTHKTSELWITYMRSQFTKKHSDNHIYSVTLITKNVTRKFKLAVKGKSPTSIMEGKPAAGIVDREFAAEYQVILISLTFY